MGLRKMFDKLKTGLIRGYSLYNPHSQGIYDLHKYNIYDPTTHRTIPNDTLVLPRGQSIYDPMVFGIYDLSSQRVMSKSDPIADSFSLDIAMRSTQRHCRRHANILPSDRYTLVLDLLVSGFGICLDACTASPREDVKKTIQDHGYEYLPIDISGANDVRKEDLTKLSFGDGEISCIISCDTLEHIDDFVQAIRELFRVLAPGGLAYLHVPVYYFDKSEGEPIRMDVDPWGHLRYFSARELLAHCQTAGFVIMRANFNFDSGSLLAVVAKPPTEKTAP